MKKHQLSPSHSASALLDEKKDLILFNDDVNTFEYIIENLIEICDHEPEQAEQCAMIAHFKGKCGIRSGPAEVLEPMNNQLNSRGISTVLA
jgi:ATP-dependent Clp protease adaptor protein ClpS